MIVRPWTILLGGLVIWTAHFLTLYGLASIFPGRSLANWLVLPATIIAVVALVFVLRAAILGASAEDPLDRWIGRLGTFATALSLLAVLWQAVPAVA